ncbi:MAG: hypothetical protein ACE360_12250 [Hyphomicrobiales bacterium]
MIPRKPVDDSEGMTLFGASIGFVGYGSIVREVHRLPPPFDRKVSTHDPWLPEARARDARIACRSRNADGELALSVHRGSANARQSHLIGDLL